MTEPTIPNEPTIPTSAPPQDIDDEEISDDEKPKAGRPSNKVLAADVKRLETENRRLRDLVATFASIPDDAVKPADAVLYQLRRGNESCTIHCRDIRRARQALQS